MTDDRRERVEGSEAEREGIADRIIHALDDIAREYDDFAYGLPVGSDVMPQMRDAVLAALGEPQEAGEMEWIVEVRDPAIGGWREESKRVSRERAEEIARLWRPGVSGLRVRIVPLLRGTPVEIEGNE